MTFTVLFLNQNGSTLEYRHYLWSLTDSTHIDPLLVQCVTQGHQGWGLSFSKNVQVNFFNKSIFIIKKIIFRHFLMILRQPRGTQYVFLKNHTVDPNKTFTVFVSRPKWNYFRI
jgi:hypothetical protein